MTFKELNLSAPLLRAVQEAGYETPSPIQAAAIPPVLSGRDLMGCAQTGTGKTAAFALPMLDRLTANAPRRKGAIRALILTPTRELALQIGESFDAYGKYLKLRSTVIFGGVGQAPQVEALKKGVDILIACPGRLNDLIGQGFIDLSNLEIFVLDEADRMLDMGFVHDVKKVIAKLPGERQNLMFSATMPTEIEQLAAGILRKPAFVKVDPVSSTVDRIQQSLYHVEKGNKKFLLPWLIKNLQPPVVNALVFSRTKHGADKIAKDLTKQGIPAAAIHGNKSQTARVTALENFKAGKTKVLVATDIAARGIDISELSHVFNYDLPEVPETYVHRIGRTARAGRKGKAITFVGRRDFSLMSRIERFIGVKLTPEPVLTAVQVDQLRTESLVDDILERLKPDAVLPEELKEVEAAPEAMAAALFDLLRERTHREVQPIPEDKPARRARRMPQTGEEAESPQKGDSWQHKGDTVTLFMNGGRMIGLRPKDIAGLFYNTVEMEKGAVGDIRIFPKHSLIEVDASVAPLLLEALATATVCGYEVNVREDKGAPEYSGTPRSSRRNGGFRNSYRGERDRSDRSGFRGNRGGFRSDRGERWGERSRRDDRKKRF
jgi:DEAD/DEAH box helicase domain protein